MDLGEYQHFCSQKQNYDTKLFAIGLGGETGEVLDIIKKSYRDNKPVDLTHLREELGDVLWYVANLCNAYNITMQSAIDYNVEKLKKRYEINEKD